MREIPSSAEPTQRLYVEEYGRMLASRLPNARYVELPGRGHNVQLEDRATINRLVLEFLAE